MISRTRHSTKGHLFTHLCLERVADLCSECYQCMLCLYYRTVTCFMYRMLRNLCPASTTTNEDMSWCAYFIRYILPAPINNTAIHSYSWLIASAYCENEEIIGEGLAPNSRHRSSERDGTQLSVRWVSRPFNMKSEPY